MEEIVCPVCRNADGHMARASRVPNFDRSRVACVACGDFTISRTALVDGADPMNEEQRRAMSHDLRWKNELSAEPPYVTTATFDDYRKHAALPPIPEQVDNALSYLAVRLRYAGRFYDRIDPALTSAIGAIDMNASAALILSMERGGLLTCADASSMNGPNAIRIAPTLEGWLRAGEIAKGQRSENFAFMAMKYGDETLEACVANVIRPAVEEAGYKLEVLRDRPAAGLIDNYLRSRLRLCKFVIADLSHANNGAYWEAGFAEGLGKPVIYTCERGVFDTHRTHFDTNHSQTVVWEVGMPQETQIQLLACIRNTFPDSK